MAEKLSQLKSFLTTRGKGLSLLLTMLVGGLTPQFHTFTFLIQYLLMAMLFFAFLDIEFKPRSFQKSMLWVLLANVAIAFMAYSLLTPFDLTLALAAFMTAIAPTAIAAPVIASARAKPFRDSRATLGVGCRRTRSRGADNNSAATRLVKGRAERSYRWCCASSPIS